MLKQLGSAMDEFEIGSEILPGTKAPAAGDEFSDFEVGPISTKEGDQLARESLGHQQIRTIA